MIHVVPALNSSINIVDGGKAVAVTHSSISFLTALLKISKMYEGALWTKLHDLVLEIHLDNQIVGIPGHP
jgi:hypothetical protein